jgi:hypothetical protein
MAHSSWDTLYLMYQFTRRLIKLIVIIVEAHHSYELLTKFYPISFSHSQVYKKLKLLRIMAVGLDVTVQVLITFFAFVKYWRKSGSITRQYSSYS